MSEPPKREAAEHEAAIGALQREQCGMVSRAQVLSRGGDDLLISRRLRRREWARVHPGVYVDHTGPLTWEQRAWAAVLALWPAALASGSALCAQRKGLPASLTGGLDDDIHVVVAHGRRVSAPPGVRVTRLRDYEAVISANLSPPRMRFEDAVLREASARATDDSAVAVLADACQSRRTNPERLLRRLQLMGKLPRRSLLVEVLDDVASGALSTLERRYLRKVERRHGLPPATRQLREATGQGVVFRDAFHPDHAFLVELDGRLGHEWNADRWSDLDRDVASAEEQRLTIRVGWKQVLDPCRLALSVVRILRARGWTGSAHPCSETCPVGVRGGSSAPGAEDPPQTAA